MLGSKFWANKYDWPFVTPGYTFFPDAFEEIGKALFPEDWTGEEAVFMGAGEKIPSASDVFLPDSDAPKDFELLRKHQQDVFRLLDLPAGKRPPTWDEWCEARTRWYDLDIRAPRIVARCNSAIDEIHNAAAEGLLVLTVRRKGEMVDLPPSTWNCDRPLVCARFEHCALSTEDPFQSPPSVEELLITSPTEKTRQFAYWRSFTEFLFARNDRLASSIAGVFNHKSRSNGSTGGPLSDQSRKLPFDRSSPWAEISEWYLSRVSEAPATGYTRTQDEAAGKAVGIGRDRVRDLRKELAPNEWSKDGPRKK